MADHNSMKRSKVIVSILILLLPIVTLITISGCGNDHNTSISGSITSGGLPLSGVTMTLSGDASRTTVTDVKGHYSFSDLPEGTFKVTPSLTSYTFTPINKTVYIYGIDKANGISFNGTGEGRIAASTDTVYLKSDGTVWAWGSNSNGQLGNGSTTDSAIPVQVSGLSSMIAIAAGNSHTVAMQNFGSIWTWGSNSNGQLGDGSTADSTIPVKLQWQ